MSLIDIRFPVNIASASSATDIFPLQEIILHPYHRQKNAPVRRSPPQPSDCFEVALRRPSRRALA
jgi:hypothetical protein